MSDIGVWNMLTYGCQLAETVTAEQNIQFLLNLVLIVVCISWMSQNS